MSEPEDKALRAAPRAPSDVRVIDSIDLTMYSVVDRCPYCGARFREPGRMRDGTVCSHPTKMEAGRGFGAVAGTAPVTRVVNLRDEPYDIYIGRSGKGHDGYYGNPFRLDGEPRGSTIERYRVYFEERIARDTEFRQRVLALRGKRLGCFCKPEACHGDVIAAWLERQP